MCAEDHYVHLSLQPREEEKAQKKKPEKPESGAPAGTSKGKKIRRRTAEGASG